MRCFSLFLFSAKGVIIVNQKKKHVLFNVSSTNLEQSKLCVNSPLYIDTRLFGEQAIGCNSA